MTCRSGCRSKDHGSYAECLRAANISSNELMNNPKAHLYAKTKADLAAYQSARRNGIQPEGTTVEKVKAAQAATERLGRPYNAEKDPPARMISTATAAKFVNTKE